MAETKFSVMVSLFNWMQKSKSSSVKRSKFRKFLETFCRPNNSDDYFSAIRLILPTLDRERGSYGLREHVLATCLIDALGMSRDSPDSQRLLNWRKGGPKSGAFAGSFSLVAAEVLQRRQGLTSGDLTVKELNQLLDRLASCENRSEKTSILSDLIRKTNSQEMKWIIMIILKDLKLGISEKSIFHEFHPDAEDLFNVTCDLKLVCEKLRDRSQRHKRQDIEVGKPVRPQLALRVRNAAAAWKKLHGKEVVVECKFDGDRIQIHKNGAHINFFSRNFIDHPEYGHGMSDIIRQNILVDRCILDGEMLVWDKSSNRFAEFGSNQEIAKAAKDGLDSDRQLCYVAFDILYAGDTSVIHQSLKERHQLLRQVVKPESGRLEILVPNGGLNAHRPAGEPSWSLIVHDVDAVERFFKETIENRSAIQIGLAADGEKSVMPVKSLNYLVLKNRRNDWEKQNGGYEWRRSNKDKDEGIVLKDIGSKWEPSDRSGKWLKLKPDYIRAGSDLDVLIIGGYYGSGRRGGEVAQFLVGLAEQPAPNTYPRRFVSFCRVGTGLSDDELNSLVAKLKPYLRKYEYPKKAPPSFYQVTNNSKERPDVWVESPEKSIIVSITSDIRTIRSEVFAAPYGLRFPRIDRVRYDKPWHECLDVQSFVELVHSSNGTIQKAMDYANVQENKPKRTKSSRGMKKNVSVVPSHFVQTDVSQVKGETSIFSNMIVYFVNTPSSHSLDSLHKMVVENGGSFSMNLNNSVTHSIASESKGIKFQAAKRHGDVIHCSWLFDCCVQKKLVPLQPKYFLFLSDTSKKKLEEEIDKFSDSYYLDLDVTDLKQILSTIGTVEDSKVIEYYKKKFCPREEWMRFHGCCIYFHLPRKYLKYSWEVTLELTIRRMKIEICISGGSVAETLSHATHVVIVSSPQIDVDFDMLLSSLPEAERPLLRRLKIVTSRWLDDCFEKNQKLLEDNYSLKPQGFEETLSPESNKHDFTREESPNMEVESEDASKDGRKTKATLGKPKIVSLPNRDGKRKRGRPSQRSLNTGKSVVNQSRRTRPRVGKKPAKISEIESDENSSSDEKEDSNHGSSEMLKNKRKTGSNQPRTKRALIKNKRAQIEETEFDKDSSSEEQSKKEKLKVNETNENLVSPEFQKEEAVKDYITETGKAVVAEQSENRQRLKETRYEPQSSTRLEDSVDPVQAMLLNMVPFLATQKVETATSVPEDVTAKARDPVRQEEEKLPLDSEKQPVKKKKVSYKDLATDLLKDW